jgi:hypothetical protein
MDRPFRQTTPVDSSVWGGTNSNKLLRQLQSFSLLLPENKSSFFVKRSSYYLSSKETKFRKELGGLDGSRSSQFRSGSDQGPLSVFSQQAPINSSFALFGDHSVESPHGVPFGIRQGAVEKRGNRTCTGQSGGIFPRFHGVKEGRLCMSSNQCKNSKQICYSSKVSDGISLHRG